MKTLGSQLLFFVIVSVAFNSCDKDDPKPVCFISSYTNQGDTYNFLYDDNNVLISRMLEKVNTVLGYEYDSDGRLARLKNNGELSAVLFHSGDAIVKKDSYAADGSGEIFYTDEYSYDDNNRLIERRAFGYTSDGDPYQTVTITFEYPGKSNNVGTIRFFTPGNTSAYLTQDYTYGEQPYGFNAFPAEIKKLQKLSSPYENVPTRIVSKDAGGTWEVNISYTFNADGYPTRQIETHSDGNVMQYDFKYACHQ